VQNLVGNGGVKLWVMLGLIFYFKQLPK